MRSGELHRLYSSPLLILLSIVSSSICRALLVIAIVNHIDTDVYNTFIIHLHINQDISSEITLQMFINVSKFAFSFIY